MTTTEWRVAIGDDETRAVYEPPTAGDETALFVFAHGAGGNMSDRAMLAATNTFRRRGIGVVRFNFLYKERGSGRPDPMPKLMATVAAIVERTRQELGEATDKRPLLIGGRSMGGRAASMLAAEGFDADGLLLLAYPLHPEGKPEQLRDAHLAKISMPVLCFNGTRDGLCTPSLMERTLAQLPATARWEMHWLEGADHSFHVLKSSGRTDAQVLDEVGDVTTRWLSQLRHPAS